ncbi:hypothetical protein TSAR_011440 [Trichomalopsis sarcophagae]|uniref:Uncharacterized protein n=1 Tax=Trichomalopsis sarcophagae TaxID=543379 RepID=A0A232EZZ1_9HYME|nr:hypothetical protein TSAR_011440 [Trichomalopsis sarcophagae]
MLITAPPDSRARVLENPLNSLNSSLQRQTIDYADYSNPIDQLPTVEPIYHQRRPLDYDTLESHSPNLSFNRQQRYQRNASGARQTPPVTYSPLMRSRQINRAGSGNTGTGSSGRQNRNSYRPRVYADHIREQQPPPLPEPRLRSFHSDPRLSVEEQELNAANAGQRDDQARRRGDGRPLSIKKKKKQPRPLYSIEYSQPEPPVVQDESVSPKPMTPRRVKRRSVISRDGTRRSTNSRRSSVRQSRRKNPVNRIMEHHESLYANTPPIVANLTNQNVNSMSHGTLNYDRISGHWDRGNPAPPNWQPDTMNLAASSPNIWSGDPNAYPAVISGNLGASTNWESASSTRNLAESWQQPPPQLPVIPSTEIVSSMQWQGQSNPSFQQTSTQSLNGEDLDDLYGNRPASARSSYSNYHGVRATPQVPSRTDIVRQSQRQFVLSGPPAYQDTVI